LANKRAVKALGAAAAVMMTLTGCSTAAEGALHTATTAAHAVKHASAQTTLTVVPSPNGNVQDNFNPFSANANYGTLGMLYECLFYIDNVTGKTFPLLGKSYNWSNSNKTLTVQLRSGVKWSDGTAFTAKDVVATFAMLKKYPDADTNGVWQQLSSVSAKGNNVVVFQMKSANVPFAQYILGDPIVPQNVWAKIGDPTKATITKPVGTGPYTLMSFNPQDFKYQVNTHYWGGVSAVKVVDFPSLSGNDSGDLQLAKGNVDWAGMFIPNIKGLFVNHDAKHNNYWFPPGNVTGVYLNLKNPLLSQLAVRQAISLGINRMPLATEGEYGYTQPASPTGLVLPNNQAWLDPSISKSQLSYQYNPTQAEKILQKAGFKKNAQGIYAKNGKPLAFTLQVVAGWTDWDTDCQLISSDLKKIGIQVTVQQEQYGAYANNLQSPTHKVYDMALSWTNSGAVPYTLYENLLDSKGNYNVEQLNNPMVNATLHDYSVTTNAAKQKQDMYKIEKYMVNNLPFLPMFYGPIWYEYRTTNFTGFPDPSHPYVNPAPWTNYAQAIVLMHLRPAK